MWFIFSIFTVFAWSGSDLFSKMGSKSNDKFSHWKMVIAVGIVMGLHAFFQIFVQGADFDLKVILTYLPVSFLYILSMILGYAGLRYAQLSISSPICNSSGAITSILVFIFLGQTMTTIQLFGVSLICLGVILLSVIETGGNREGSEELINNKYKIAFLGIFFPILYCLIDGIGSFADALVLETLDETQANIAYELTFLFMAIVAFIYVVIIKKEKFIIRNEKFKFTAAIFETAGQFTYIYAMGDKAVIAAPLIASYSLFSIVWSRIFLKEKLTLKHYSVLILVMCGIAILGME